MENQNILVRGTVVLVNFGSGEGSEQQGSRPALIVSNDRCNQYSPVITVLPLTSKVFKKSLPTHVILKSDGKYDIHTDSVVLAEQIRTVSVKRISSQALFKLDYIDMAKVDRAMAIQMGILPNTRINQVAQ